MADHEDLLPAHLEDRAKAELHETSERHAKALEELLVLLDGEAAVLRTRTDPMFLLRFLRARKFDTPAAFQLLRNYYRMRFENPDLYQDLYPSSVKEIFDLQCLGFLRDPDAEGRKVFLLRMGKWSPDVCSLEAMYKPSTLAWELALEEAGTQVNGIVALVDLDGGSLKHVASMSPAHAFKIVYCVQECYPIRLKAIHIVNQPLFFTLLLRFLKPLVKNKFFQRLHLHGRNYASLHEYLPREILPSEYGGEREPFDNSEFVDALLRNEEAFKLHETFGYRQRSLSPAATPRAAGSFPPRDSRVELAQKLWRRFAHSPLLPDDVSEGSVQAQTIQKCLRKMEESNG
ncbi:alpha-tocopherol transfer protein-like isoform X1 [Amblyomma americanum]